MNKILIPKAGNSTLTMIYVPVGARNEPNEIKGVSHFLEHMMFKGTKTRTAKEIAYEVEKYGADFNAFTDYEMTAYWARSANKDKGSVKSILLDMLENSTFPQEEMDKERNVILQELKMYDDSPRYLVWDVFYKALFAKQDGMHLPIIGTTDSLDKIDRTVLCNYYKVNYNTPTLIQVGDVKESIDIQNSTQFALPPMSRTIKTEDADSILLVKKKGITQANIIIGGLVTPDGTNRLSKYFSASLLASVMNDMSGRLFSVVREQHNLCYSIRFGCSFYGCGTFVWNVSLGLETDKIPQAYELIMQELNRGISKEEAEYAYNKKVGKLTLYNDEVSSIARQIAGSSIRGLDFKEVIYNYEKYLNKSKETINDFMQSINFKNNIMVQVIPE